MKNSIIVSGDRTIREQLNSTISRNFHELTVSAVADCGADGLLKITANPPDLVFIDIDLPDMNGFDMLQRLSEISFHTVFLASYNHPALKVVRFNELDYLIKPVDAGSITRITEAYLAKSSQHFNAGNVRQALLNLQVKNVSEQIWSLSTLEGAIQLVLKDIVRIEGERNQSCIFLTGRKIQPVARTLGAMEELLNDKGFYRCHKSYLINHAHIKCQSNSISLILSDDTTVPIARRKKDDFVRWYTHG